jgi:hypothetical protein
MSDTPRTDALWPVAFIERGYAQNGDTFGWGELKRATDFARELERELVKTNDALLNIMRDHNAALLIQLARLESKIERLECSVCSSLGTMSCTKHFLAEGK